MEKNSQPIIIKKKKGGHAGHHGGAWKVAYADFVTALMAFFLVMWLVASVAPEKKARVAQYMRNYSIFAESGKSFMTGTSQVLNQPDKGFRPTPQDTVRGSGGGGVTQEEMVKKMKKAIEEKLASVKNQVTVDIIEGGVRVQITDTEGGMMFPSGSADLTEKAKEILRIVAENIKNVPNRIAVEGHTDAAPFKGAERTNWELSTARASAARRMLEEYGIDSSRIARVVGYADQELIVPENPNDPRNRRISIILINDKSTPPAEAPLTK
ncbi:MAG: flagellar motor protein MotB [Syntrophales bacterium]